MTSPLPPTSAIDAELVAELRWRDRCLEDGSRSEATIARTRDVLRSAADRLDQLSAEVAAKDAEIAGLRAQIEKPEPMFPIMGGPNVPWTLIAPYEAQAQKNHYQTLKRLAERGGLGISEAMAVMSGVAYEKRPIAKPSVEDWLDFIADRKARASARAALTPRMEAET